MNVQIPALLKSRRFWTALIGIVVLVITQLNAEAGGTLGRLQEEIVSIVGLLLGGYIVEDLALAVRGEPKPKAPVSPAHTGRD